MKSIISLFLTILLSCTMFFTSCGNSQVTEDETFVLIKDEECSVYENYGSTETLTFAGYKGDELDIEIPSTIKGKKVTIIGTLSKSDIKSLKIPDTVKTIEGFAFEDCKKLEKICIPTSVVNIGYKAFNKTKLYKSQPDGVLMIDGLVVGYKGDCPENLVIPKGARLICDYAFENNKKITSVTFPDTVTHIGEYAFSGCKNIESIKLSSNLKHIGLEAFGGCSRLKEIDIPDTVRKLGNHAFSGCKALEKVKLSANLKIIGAGAFEGCKVLTSVKIPYGVKTIESDAFYGCHKLAQVEIPDSIERVGMWAFKNTNWYTRLPKGPVYIGNVLYDIKGKGTKYMKVKDGTKSITSYSFEGWEKNIREVYIPDSVTYIEYSAFQASNVKKVRLPETLKKIEGALFAGANINSIEIPGNVKVIDNEAFQECWNLESVVLPKNLKKIDFSAFEECKSLKEVEIPEGTKKIGSSAFYNCENLEKVIIPETVKTIEEYAFEGCDKLIIYGKEDSVAIKYAKKNKIAYQIY